MKKSFLEHLQKNNTSLIAEDTTKKKKKKLVRKPYHSYHTKDGHLVHVHLEKDEFGHYAVFKNQNLGGELVKIVHWKHPHDRPSKKDLEKAGHSDE